MKKTEITERQKQQFNKMLDTLRRIKYYQSTSQLRRDSEKDWGLEYTDALEMAYENIQQEASISCKGIKPLK